MADAAQLNPSMPGRMRQRGLWFALGSVVLVSIAQLMMKWAMTQVAITPDTLHAPQEVISTLSWSHVILPLVLGMSCYAVSVACWMGALARLPLSLAYPLLSLSYPLVYIGAILSPVFHETLNWQRLLAIACIMLGVALLMIDKKS